MVEIIPAIIPDSFSTVEEKVSLIKDVAARVQIDVIDGAYAPKASWPYNKLDEGVFRSLVREERGLPYWEFVGYEIDMMVQAPEEKLDDWISAGAEAIIIHVESTTRFDEIMMRGAERGVDIALALKPSTDVAVLAPWVDKLAFVQCMGNDEIGRHGIPIDQRIFERLRALRATYPTLSLGVDIGVSLETAPLLVSAGATRLTAGSAIFSAEVPSHMYRELLQVARKDIS